MILRVWPTSFCLPIWILDGIGGDWRLKALVDDAAVFFYLTPTGFIFRHYIHRQRHCYYQTFTTALFKVVDCPISRSPVTRLSSMVSIRFIHFHIMHIVIVLTTMLRTLAGFAFTLTGFVPPHAIGSIGSLPNFTARDSEDGLAADWALLK